MQFFQATVNFDYTISNIFDQKLCTTWLMSVVGIRQPKHFGKGQWHPAVMHWR